MNAQLFPCRPQEAVVVSYLAIVKKIPIVMPGSSQKTQIAGAFGRCNTLEVREGGLVGLVQAFDESA